MIVLTKSSCRPRDAQMTLVDRDVMMGSTDGASGTAQTDPNKLQWRFVFHSDVTDIESDPIPNYCFVHSCKRVSHTRAILLLLHASRFSIQITAEKN